MKARPSGLLLALLAVLAIGALAKPERPAPRPTAPPAVGVEPDTAPAPGDGPPVAPAPRMAAVETKAEPTEPPATPAALARRAATVNVSSGRVRAGPSLEARQIGSLPRGAKVAIVGTVGEWLSIEATAQRVIGWMHQSTLALGSAEQPERSRSATAGRQGSDTSRPAPAPLATAAPRGPSDSDIRQAIIRQSIASDYGSCPCPYHVDRGGRQCGGRSAYSKPGGRSPICYAKDVTPAMIARFRSASR